MPGLEIWEPVKESTNELLYVTLKRTHTFRIGNRVRFVAKNVKDMVPKSNNIPRTKVRVWTRHLSDIDSSGFTNSTVNACLQRCWGFSIVIAELKVWNAIQSLVFVTKLSVLFPDGPESVGSPIHQHHNDPIPTAAHSSVGKTFMGWEIYVWIFPKDKGQCWPGRRGGWLVNLIPLKFLYSFLSLGWFEVEQNFETTTPSPQVILPDTSHPTTFTILLNISCLFIDYAGVH